jgi:thymidylate kinase
MYKLSQDLIDELNKENIRYCHWKSNLLLNDALDGYDDLDLLVNRDDIYKFEKLIIQLGFKEASNKNISFSSIKHFYGYDNKSGELLHLHIYYQVKTGPSWTKSIHFDFENYILDNLIVHESGIHIPKKHIELVIFIFRIMLKYSKVNEFILVNREHERTLNEIIYLQNGANRDKVKEFLESYFSNISEKEFYSYIDIIRDGSKIKKYLAGKRVKKRLKEYRYMGSLKENYINISQLFYRSFNKLFFKQKKKIHSTGTLIVIAGLDATGKTTITYDLKKWLGKNFTLSLIHFGKPNSTLITYPFNFLIKLLRREASSNNNLKSSIQQDTPKPFIYLVRQVILAYDRYTLAKKCWEKTSSGEIVILDRYKSEDYGVMDSKRLNTIHYSGLKLKLAEFENHLYDTMPTPDVLFYLTVPVEIAVQRNHNRIKEGKESEEFIRLRHKQNRDLNYIAHHTYIIDTNQPYESEIRDIKSKIWNIL